MQLATFTTANGDEVVVQVPDDDARRAGPTVRGWSPSQVAERAEQRLDDALAKVQPTIDALVTQIRSLADAPDGIEVQFGIQLSVEVGAFITGTSSANFQVTMRWAGRPDRAG